MFVAIIISLFLLACLFQWFIQPKLIIKSISPDGKYTLEVYETERFMRFVSVVPGSGSERIIKEILKDSNGNILNSEEELIDSSITSSIKKKEFGWDKVDWRMPGCAWYGPKSGICINK